jgi:hypothetical protein
VPEDEPGQFSKYVQESREALTRLLVKIKNWRPRKPEIKRVDERRWRAENRLIHPPQHLDANKRSQRSRPAFEVRQAAYTEVWQDFGTLTAEVRTDSWNGVGGGIRTLGHRNHNPALYQLSYTHREGRSYRIREWGRLQIWSGGEVGAGI